MVEFPQNNRPQIALLTGAVGEGKSTALRQATLTLLQDNHYNKIIWHEDTETSLFGNNFGGFINSLEGKSEKILFVSDDAEKIKEDLLKSIVALSRKAVGNIHFLLCSCNIDWDYIEVNNADWERHGNFNHFVLEGITELDATNIVTAWENWSDENEKVLGNLVLFPTKEQQIEQLINYGSENIEGEKSKAFLAALLGCRGEPIEKRVQTLLYKIHRMAPPNSGKTLLDAYALIAPLSSENLVILEENILSSALGCYNAQELRNSYLMLLGNEVKSVSLKRGGKTRDYILTRHRLIAETAIKILEKSYFHPFNFSMKSLIPHFIQQSNFLSGEDTKIWNRLPHYFFEKDKKDLGISLAEEFVDSQPDDPYPITDLSNLLRNDNQNMKAVELCRKNFKFEVADAAFYQEWGTAERSLGNSRLAVWMSFISICDIREPRRQYPGRWMNSLSGLAGSFCKLYKQSSNPLFLESCASSVRLGLLSSPDKRARENLITNGIFCVTNGKEYEKMDKEEALANLLKGVEVAFDERGMDNLSEPVEFPADQVPNLDKLRFTGLYLKFTD